MSNSSCYTGSPFSDRESWWTLIVGMFPTGVGWALVDSCGGVLPPRMQQQVLWKLLLQSLATLVLLAWPGPDSPVVSPEKTFHSLLSLEDGERDRAIDEEGLRRHAPPLLSRAKLGVWLWPWVWLWTVFRWWCFDLGTILRQWTPSKLWKAFLNSWLEHG